VAKFLAYILALKTANIGDLKDNLSKFISFVEQGEVVEICKRNIPIALLVPHGFRKP
jgi:antitoxin (DNA-binding transcriptional repressor) of toxin-antitoxin stability system